MTYQLRPSPHLNPGELIPDESLVEWPSEKRLAVAMHFELWSSESFDSLQIIGSTVDFAVRRGLGNVLELLERHEVPATFFVNGVTAERHPDAIATIGRAGHEVAPLGHRLIPHWNLTDEEVHIEVARGVAAVEQASGHKVRGWRTPTSRPSPETLPAVRAAGLDWDSSIRNDEMVAKFPVGGGSLVEIPFGGAVDYSYYSPFPGPVRLIKSVMSAYLDEIEVLRNESSTAGRLAVLNFNPSYSGRPPDLAMLNRIITALKESPAAWFARCSDISDWVSKNDQWFPSTDSA